MRPRRGGTILSFDPLYAYDVHDISKRINDSFDDVMRETRNNMDEFVWKHIRSIDELGEVRMKAMRAFLKDYPQGKAERRYLPESAPILSFPDKSFDLCVCSHFLFLYSDHLDHDFHIDAISELCRVSREIRIFPLLQLGSVPSPHVQAVNEHFRTREYDVMQVQVPYEFQRGGNKMLRIKRFKQ